MERLYYFIWGHKNIYKTHKKATEEQVYEACEILEAGLCGYSCYALATATKLIKESEIASWPPCLDYAEFYEKEVDSFWGFSDIAEVFPTAKSKQERIIALLLYLEARDYV